MELYLAGEHPVKNGAEVNWEDLNILESFYYARKNRYVPQLISSARNFLLDSGAFTFMNNCRTLSNFDNYLEEYAEFIRMHNVRHFFELDIDSIVGLKEVERLRVKLERLTQRSPIPVWHKNRGLEYFVEMCRNYSYVAIGGIVTREIKIEKYERLFPWFIETAHKYGTKIHGLGYTRIPKLRAYHFDSVDSTAWIFGNISGRVYEFNPQTASMSAKKVPMGKRLKSRQACCFNFNQWVRLMKYARTHF